MDETNTTSMQGPVCPIPLQHTEKIVLGHGSGGKMMNDLIQNTFFPPLDNPVLSAGNDAGVVQLEEKSRLAICTDAHVVSPLFFPGGDIGKLAVCGTVNDVSMLGAEPLYLTASFILEEGLNLHTLENVVSSMKMASEEAGVIVVAGDTKVVQKGKADGLYISTAGVGRIFPGVEVGGSLAKSDDVIIVSGTLGDHGISVLSARGDLGFTTDIESDIAPLNHLVAKILEISKNIHVLRDPTRGGLASTLNEIACQSEVPILIEEENIPVHPTVKAACEMLGFDPLYIANEGKLVVFVAPEDAHKVLEVMRSHPYGEQSSIIGQVLQDGPKGRVLMRTLLGSKRIVDTLSGEMLPRIC